MRLIFFGLFFSCVVLTGCSDQNPEDEELEKVVYLEEETALERE